MVLGTLSFGIKQPGREVDHTAPSCADVKNEWSSTAAPTIYLHDVNRDSFTCFESQRFIIIYKKRWAWSFVSIEIKFEVFRAVKITVVVFWANPAAGYHRFGITCCLHLHIYPDA
jgi:hypothetical protein